jgi:16S rRNA (cytosine1402-N4)-methyltransferase
VEFSHISVLLNECIEALDIKPDGIYVDGTAGGAGHSSEIAKRLANGRLIAIDKDPDAVQTATERLAAYACAQVFRGDYSSVKEILASLQIEMIDGMLLDLGVSSHQLDTPERGFSYHEDAPLDMRMDPDYGVSAAEWLQSVSQQELTRVLLDYGEERWAARIAQFVVERRRNVPVLTTGDLVRIIDDAIPKAVRRKDEGHPARRTFQAIRIAVNDELVPLSQALSDFVDCLKPGGRLCVITFHSLEDRLVKQAFRAMQNPCVCPPKAPICTCGKKPVGKVLAGGAVQPTAEEVARNARARSAKLRVVERV